MCYLYKLWTISSDNQIKKGVYQAFVSHCEVEKVYGILIYY